jgi:predicted phage gp36 major capsid-like protein
MTRHFPRPRATKEGEADGPTSLEVVEAFDEFMTAFEAFKDANDERLAQIESRVSADVVTTEKMERINRALDEHKRLVDGLVLKSRRPPLSGDRAELSVSAL